MSYRVTIPGEPVGKGRPRAAATRAGVRMYTPARTVAWERGAAYVMRQAHSGPPLTGPLAIEVVALHGRPQRLDCEHKRQPCSCDDDWRERQPHLAAPDLDNIVKAACDALQLGGVVADDRTICRATARKAYAAHGEEPCVIVELMEA